MHDFFSSASTHTKIDENGEENQLPRLSRRGAKKRTQGLVPREMERFAIVRAYIEATNRIKPQIPFGWSISEKYP